MSAERMRVTRGRLRELGASFAANDNIAAHLSEDDIADIQENVEAAARQLLDALLVDLDNDPHARGTAKRYARMLVREVFRGRYERMPDVTDFPNSKRVDELYCVGPIAVRSTCAHHLVPVIGTAWVGVIPGERIIGLSKFHRLVEWVMARPQIQEEACVQVADVLERLIVPRALGVVIDAQHHCVAWRGVRQVSGMTTSVMRGLFRENFGARTELFSMLRGKGWGG